MNELKNADWALKELRYSYPRAEKGKLHVESSSEIVGYELKIAAWTFNYEIPSSELKDAWLRAQTGCVAGCNKSSEPILRSFGLIILRLQGVNFPIRISLRKSQKPNVGSTLANSKLKIVLRLLSLS